MLRRFRIHALVGLVALATTSCSVDENVVTHEQGRFTLDISTSAHFEMADGSIFEPEGVATPAPADYAVTLSSEGTSHTWASFKDISMTETFQSGTYTVKLQSGGEPSFGGESEFDIEAGNTTNVHVDCSPLQGIIMLNISEVTSPYTFIGALCQSRMGTFKQLDANAYNYVEPGEQTVLVALADEAGRERTFSTGYTAALEAAHGADVGISLDGTTLQTGTATRTITPEAFAMDPPVITPRGFTPGVTVKAIEGITLEQQPIMEAKSATEINHAWLSVTSPIIDIARIDRHFDLMHLTDDQRAALARAGLDYTASAGNTNLTVNFARAIEQLAGYTSALSTFTLVVETIDGVCSQPVSLSVSTEIVGFELISTMPAEIGTDEGGVVLHSDVTNVERDDFSVVTTTGVLCPITGWSSSDGRVSMNFSVPEGNDNVDIVINYLGLRRLTASIQRVAPATQVSTDAFATTLTIVLDAGSQEATRAMTRFATPYVDGKRASIVYRDADTGIIVLNGLKPDTRYVVTLAAGTTANAGSAVFTTEKAEQLPDPSFEDWTNSIEYKNMPAGGRYSATTAPLFNRQNFVNVDVKWIKKGWTSINAKTFNKAAKRHNAWFMQPSTAVVWDPQDGNKAMCLTSVGWDNNGPAIPDYVQLPGQNLLYNPNVPEVSHRSAGRLFLGDYKYDTTSEAEVHDEGIGFTSRPASLNGFYKYFPDVNAPSDAGLVIVRVLGKDASGNEITIASGEMQLPNSPDYKAFNVPLTYNMINVAATRLCIMFASSFHIGSQEQEDASVPVTANIQASEMTGSRLYIDNLSLSY